MKSFTTFFEQVPIESVDAIMNEIREKQEGARNIHARLQAQDHFNHPKDLQMLNDAPPDECSPQEAGEGQQHARQLENCKPEQEGHMQNSWRKIAEEMQSETDPARLLDLADQLMADFDRHQSLDLPKSTRTAEPTTLESPCQNPKRGSIVSPE